MDSSGTPLQKNSEVVSNNTGSENVETSGYDEKKGNFDDPTTSVKPKQSFAERVKENLRSKYNTVKSNIKQNVTFDNAKRMGAQVVRNVGNNMKEDVSYLGKQGVSTVRQIGITEKQSKKRYGDDVVPAFGYGGGFGQDVFGKMAQSNTVKIKNKNKMQQKNVNNSVVNVVVKKRKNVKSIHSVGVVSDPLSGMSKPRRSMDNSFDLPAFRNAGVSFPKPLKGSKTKSSNMNNSSGLFELNMFGKKKKRGLF